MTDDMTEAEPTKPIIDPEYPDVDTHWLVLRAAIEGTTGPVAELGMGKGSSRQLHALCEKLNRILVSFESNMEWAAKYTDLSSLRHTIEGAYAGWSEAIFSMEQLVHLRNIPFDRPVERFGAILVDHAPGEHRPTACLQLARLADVLVVHDTENPDYGWAKVLDAFPYRRDFKGLRPYTTAVSCFFDPLPFVQHARARFPGVVDAVGVWHPREPGETGFRVHQVGDRSSR